MRRARKMSKKDHPDLDSRGEELDHYLSEELSRRTNGSFSGLESNSSNPGRGRLTRRRLIIAVIFVSLAGATTFLFITPSSPGNVILTNTFGGAACGLLPPAAVGSEGPRRIALVDELSLQYPDSEFVQGVNSSATKAGYVLDYYPPSKVTLNFFASLPRLGYSMIIFRNHGLGFNQEALPAIVTSDSYQTDQRLFDQLFNRTEAVETDGHIYFAITPDFVTKDMCGRFPGSLIFAMWCNGGSSATPDATFAHSFIEKGASAYVGWSGPVTVGFTDAAFTQLFQMLFRGSTLGQGVAGVTQSLGTDPVYGSSLSFYPQAGSSLTV